MSVSFPRRGRPRDASRDEAICRAALDLLAERGYDNLTMELIAAHAQASKATIYRRWSSKAELVMDALVIAQPAVRAIDTGTLEGDLDALIAAGCSRRSARDNAVMCGIASALGRDPELLTCFRQRFTEPRIARIHEVLERAQQRGELDPSIDTMFAATVVPSLSLQQALLTGRGVERDYIEQVFAKVLRPMLGLSTTTTRTSLTEHA